ncbi:MAG: hemolysin family protein [Candidatus Acidiferrales bacterium]
MLALHLFVVLALVGMNAFFAAAEFSLVAVRISRVRQLVSAGDPRARIVEILLADLSRVISGVQVGITLASLALGYLGELTLSEVLRPLVAQIPSRWAAVAAHGIALVLAFGLLTVVQVILGELVPKSISLARAERVALLIARPFHWFLNSFSWAIDLLDGIAEKFVRSLGVKEAQSHTLVRSPEELQVLIEQARERGVLPATEMQIVQGAIGLAQLQVREIMVPRPDIHALPMDASLEDAMRTFATTQRSRIPVYEGTLDHIKGFVHIKDLIWIQLDRARRAEEGLPPADFNLQSYLREILIVPETKLASELLVELRSRRTEIAMVVDEFGSILGVVTLEDILEQMVGEFHDEFDVVERPMRLPDGSLIFDAALKVRDLDSQYGITVPEDSSYETIGGFVLTHLGFLPRGGESFEANGYLFTVMDMERRRVSRVKIKQVAVPAPPAPETKSATEPAKPAEEANAVAAAASETAPPETVAPARARRASRRSRS